MSDQKDYDVDSSSMRGFTAAAEGQEKPAEKEVTVADLIPGVDYDTDSSSMRMSERAQKLLMGK